MCAALGGFFLAAKLRSSGPKVGDPFTLLIVASVALGGTSLTGGRGSITGTIIGVFIVSVIQNGMNFIGVDAYWQNIVFGLFILAAVAISVDRSARGLVIK
jgi:ribose/xylose/arabinose/galactoside ABC-type transport system permease subunit